jgi:hypothetical protein
MSGLQQKYWVFHEITIGVTCPKRATCKEQAAEFFEEASALNTDAAILDLKKRILQGYVQLDGAREHPWFKLQIPEFRSFLEKYCKQHIPDQSKLRKHYLPICCEETLENIRGKIGLLWTKQRILWVALSPALRVASYT